jgi:hypothetical protein
MLERYDPDAYGFTIDPQLAGSYAGFITNVADIPSGEIYACTMAVASGTKVTFTAGADPTQPYLGFDSARLSASGALFFITDQIDTSSGDTGTGQTRVRRLDRDGTQTILDTGDIDETSLALTDPLGPQPGHVYWTKEGTPQSATIAAARR